MRFATIAVSACALAALLGGTEARAQDHSHEAGQEHPLVIEVNMADHSFSPDALRIPAGQSVQLVFSFRPETQPVFVRGIIVREVDGTGFALEFTGLNDRIRAVLRSLLPKIASGKIEASEEVSRDALFQLRLSAELIERCEAGAEEEGLSLHDWMIDQLESRAPGSR